MAIRVTEVSGDRLAEFSSRSRGELDRVDVTSPPAQWAPLKPALRAFAREYRERGSRPPRFSGVPLCLFGSEWSGFRSTPREVPAVGRCSQCAAREACGFPAEVPAELLPISSASTGRRWRDFAAAFDAATGDRTAAAVEPIVAQLVEVYGGAVSLEPSVLLSDGMQPALRFVVFPHRSGKGESAADRYAAVLERAEKVLDEIGSSGAPELFDALRGLHPIPVPVGLDVRSGRWSLKMYLRLEQADAVERQTVLDALATVAPGMEATDVAALEMVGLVLGISGLQTVKAYVLSRPTLGGGPIFPPPLAADHPLVEMSGDAALATLDIWCSGERRANKWDFNLREHYLAGSAAERLVARLDSRRSRDELAPMLVGPSYRADIVAIGVRAETLALYMELN